MPMFSYKAMNPDGRTVLGQMDTINLIDLEMRLKRMELDFIHGRPIQANRLLPSRRMPRRELINFFFQLHQLTRAGVPILDALCDLRDSSTLPRMRSHVASLIEDIEGGRTLSQAMAEQPLLFNHVMCALIRAGESTGNLPEVLENITESLKWEDELSAQTRQALTYPALTAVVVFLVLGILLVAVVPDLARFLRSSGQPIPLQMQIMVGLSNVIKQYWLLLLIVPVVLLIGGFAFVRSNEAQLYRIDALKLRLPIVGGILHKIILSRFASVFSMLYASGIPIIDAVRTTEDVVGNRAVKESLQRAGRLIIEGQNATQAFQLAGLFPPLVIRMLQVGEATGALDTALLNVAYFYNREVRESITRVQAGVGPALTIILGMIVLSIALAVIGPIYDMLTKIH